MGQIINGLTKGERLAITSALRQAGLTSELHIVLHFITFSAVRQVVAFYAPPDAKPLNVTSNFRQTLPTTQQ